MFAQLWRNGSTQDEPEIWIKENNVSAFVTELASAVDPAMTFEDVFFLLVEDEYFPKPLELPFGAYVAQCRKVGFLNRALRSTVPWVRFEAENSPYLPDAALPAEPEVPQAKGWLARLFSRR